MAIYFWSTLCTLTVAVEGHLKFRFNWMCTHVAFFDKFRDRSTEWSINTFHVCLSLLPCAPVLSANNFWLLRHDRMVNFRRLNKNTLSFSEGICKTASSKKGTKKMIPSSSSSIGLPVANAPDVCSHVAYFTTLRCSNSHHRSSPKRSW
jgi:hypothetical protein